MRGSDAVWTLALCGILFKLRCMDSHRWLSVALYPGMSWMVLVAAPAILKALPTAEVAWIVAGGLVYSTGAIIYAVERPDFIPRVFGFHELWHLFVIVGSACHFWAVIRYVAPLA